MLGLGIRSRVFFKPLSIVTCLQISQQCTTRLPFSDFIACDVYTVETTTGYLSRYVPQETLFASVNPRTLAEDNVRVNLVPLQWVRLVSATDRSAATPPG